MEHNGREQHLNTDAPRQDEPSRRFHRADTSTSSVPPVLAYLGLGKTAASFDIQEDSLATALNHHEWIVRVAAVRKLTRWWHGQAAVTPLLAALKDEHQAVRAAAARELGSLEEHTPIASLVAALHDTSWHVRSEAALALGKQQQRTPLEPLVTALHDDDEAVRAAAVGALGQLGEHVPVAPLLVALCDPSWSVREAAVHTLGALGKRAPIEPLLMARKDEDHTVREAAEQILEQTHPELLAPHDFDPNTQPLEQEAIADLPFADTALHSDPEPVKLDQHRLFYYEQEQQADSNGRWRTTEEDNLTENKRIARRLQVTGGKRQRAAQARQTKRPLIVQIVELGLVAAVIIGIALSWLLLNVRFNSNTASPWHISTFFKENKSSGGVYKKVAWLSQSAPLIAVTGTDDRIYVWNTVRDRLTWTSPPTFKNVLAMAPIEASDRVLIAYAPTTDGTVQLTQLSWDGNKVISSSPTSPIVGFGTPLAAWSPDGKYIAIAWNNHGNRTVEVWDSTGKHGTPIPLKCSNTIDSKSGNILDRNGSVDTMAWSQNGKEITTACSTSSDNGEHTIERWNAATGKPVFQFGHQQAQELARYNSVVSVPYMVIALAWSPDNKYLAYTLADGEVRVWDTDSDPPQSALNTDHASLNNKAGKNSVLAWSWDGKYLAAATSTSQIGIWDTANNPLATYAGHNKAINDIAWSPDNRQVASVSEDGTVQVWGSS